MSCHVYNVLAAAQGQSVILHVLFPHDRNHARLHDGQLWFGIAAFNKEKGPGTPSDYTNGSAITRLAPTVLPYKHKTLEPTLLGTVRDAWD